MIPRGMRWIRFRIRWESRVEGEWELGRVERLWRERSVRYTLVRGGDGASGERGRKMHLLLEPWGQQFVHHTCIIVQYHQTTNVGQTHEAIDFFIVVDSGFMT